MWRAAKRPTLLPAGAHCWMLGSTTGEVSCIGFEVGLRGEQAIDVAAGIRLLRHSELTSARPRVARRLLVTSIRCLLTTALQASLPSLATL